MDVLKQRGYKSRWYHNEICTAEQIRGKMTLTRNVRHPSRRSLDLGELAGVDPPGEDYVMYDGVPIPMDRDDVDANLDEGEEESWTPSLTRPSNGRRLVEDGLTIPGPWEVAASPSTWGMSRGTSVPSNAAGWGGNRGWGSGAPTAVPSNVGWGSST